MIDLSAACRLRLKTRADRDDVFGLPVNAIGIGYHKPAFVIGGGLEVEYASGKSIRRDVLKSVLVDAFITDAKQRQSLFPRLLTLPAIKNGDRRVAIVVPIDSPFETQRHECRRFRDEFFNRGLVGGKQRYYPDKQNENGESIFHTSAPRLRRGV